MKGCPSNLTILAHNGVGVGKWQRVTQAREEVQNRRMWPTSDASGRQWRAEWHFAGIVKLRNQ
jgi:hypothetical protein